MTALIHRFRVGSGSAFAALFGLFFPRQVRQAARALGPNYPGLSDPEDVALSAFHALWREAAAGHFADCLDNTAGLLRVLRILTAQKAARAIRYDHQERRDIGRTVRTGDPEGVPDPAGRSSRPDLDLPPALTGRQREVIRLVAAGWLVGEIAVKLECSTRTVLRELQIIRCILGRSNAT